MIINHENNHEGLDLAQNKLSISGVLAVISFPETPSTSPHSGPLAGPGPRLGNHRV